MDSVNPGQAQIVAQTMPRTGDTFNAGCALGSGGNLQPGEALAEPVLAKQFGSSRAPIREALIELEREGLVQFEATGRTRVRTLTEKDFDEIMEARVA
jgi:DNA-binding transcriptional regulator PaaX